MFHEYTIELMKHTANPTSAADTANLKEYLAAKASYDHFVKYLEINKSKFLEKLESQFKDKKAQLAAEIEKKYEEKKKEVEEKYAKMAEIQSTKSIRKPECLEKFKHDLNEALAINAETVTHRINR